MIALGINAKHSNEDTIAPFDEWIARYGDRIGLLGGFDMDLLCRSTPDEIYEIVLENGRRFRRTARGYALGSGNSIPEYVPLENYYAMLRAARTLRAEETLNSILKEASMPDYRFGAVSKGADLSPQPPSPGHHALAQARDGKGEKN